MPAEVLGYLLERNGKMLITWQIQIAEEGNVNFLLDHYAFAMGLRPGLFKGSARPWYARSKISTIGCTSPACCVSGPPRIPMFPFYPFLSPF